MFVNYLIQRIESIITIKQAANVNFYFTVAEIIDVFFDWEIYAMIGEVRKSRLSNFWYDKRIGWNLFSELHRYSLI